jgi:hypothetical protein
VAWTTSPGHRVVGNGVVLDLGAADHRHRAAPQLRVPRGCRRRDNPAPMADDASPQPDTPRQVPGCGLAAFALLLFTIFVIGLTGVSISTLSILTAGEQLSPQKLSYGGVVSPQMLAPLRDAGLIGPDEVPDAYHAENVTGSEACAISGGRLLRLGGAAGNQEMPIASITAVESTDDAVEVRGATTIICQFGPDEGAERFANMLRNR